jgi:nucleotide-binding universal stress UspA family protein
MMKRILVPLDGSTRAERSLPWARTLAPSAEVILVRAVERHGSGEIPGLVLLAEAEAYLLRMAKEFAPQARTIPREGSAAAVILDIANETAVDLISLTTHGAISPEHYSLGATAEKLMHASEAPLLIVPGWTPSPPKPRIRKLVVPLDGSAASEMIVPLARQIAQEHQAEVVLTHALPETEEQIAKGTYRGDAPLTFELQRAVERRHEELAAHFRGKAGELSKDRVRARFVMAPGRVPDAVLELAATEAADLIVMSAHGHGALQRLLFGSVAGKLIRRSPIPVLVARHDALRRMAETLVQPRW